MRETTNGIRVPEGFKTRPYSYKDPDYRAACVRDYIQTHRGETINMEDFALAAYGSRTATGGASVLLKKLRKQGRVTRSRAISAKGRKFFYAWHEQRVVDPLRTNGPVVTKPLVFKEKLTARELALKTYIDEHQGQPLEMKKIAVYIYGTESSFTAVNHKLHALLKQGRVTRQRVISPGKGGHFMYQWVGQPANEPVADQAVALSATLPAPHREGIKIDQDSLNILSQGAILEFGKTAQSDSHIAGAVHFVNWLIASNGGGTDTNANN